MTRKLIPFALVFQQKQLPIAFALGMMKEITLKAVDVILIHPYCPCRHDAMWL